jgi:hypothetical protein
MSDWSEPSDCPIPPISIEHVKYYLTRHDINSVDEQGQSLLHRAVKYNSIDIVDFLIKKNIDQFIKDKDDMFAYEYADSEMLVFIDYLNNKPCTKWLEFVDEDDEFIDYMLKNGADINTKDNCGRTLLHLTNNIERAKLYLEKGADIEARDIDGRTPFNSYNKSTEMLKFLADAGADINTRDNYLKQAFKKYKYPYKHIAAFLLELGCEFTSDDFMESDIQAILVHLTDINVAKKLINNKTIWIYGKYLDSDKINFLLSAGCSISNIANTDEQNKILLFETYI